jgi:DNA/RNA-binding domain of Phe-tRNA-synthetase-like protein
MYFCHSSAIWRDFPELVAGALFVEGLSKDVSVGPRIATYKEIAETRLATGSEAQLPEIQAWRRAFSTMGLKPTQYRCAAESLLRRLRKEKFLPSIHPLIDLCNAVSVAFAIPVAVFDVAKITEYVEVRHAVGSETYLPFSGETESPQAHEVIFADKAGRAHARRWTNRQSAYSAVRNDTSSVLIVAEALHDSASVDIPKLATSIAGELATIWSVTAKSRILFQSAPRFEESFYSNGQEH